MKSLEYRPRHVLVLLVGYEMQADETRERAERDERVEELQTLDVRMERHGILQTAHFILFRPGNLDGYISQVGEQLSAEEMTKVGKSVPRRKDFHVEDVSVEQLLTERLSSAEMLSTVSRIFCSGLTRALFLEVFRERQVINDKSAGQAMAKSIVPTRTTDIN